MASNDKVKHHPGFISPNEYQGIELLSGFPGADRAVFIDTLTGLADPAAISDLPAGRLRSMLC